MLAIKELIAVIFVAGITACSSLETDKTANWSANELYQEAKASLKDGSYTTASDYYTKLLSRYPHGELAQQSKLDLAYAYYKNGKGDNAIAEMESFIKTYPQHPYVDYAYYMLGVFAYEKDISVYDRLNPQSLTQTDPAKLKKSFAAFAKLIELYPDSEYSEDARYRLIYLNNLMGEHEYQIAKYYAWRGAYIAAINRAQNVLTKYQRSPSTPYALALMVYSYRKLNQQKQADDSMRVLELNFKSQLNEEEIADYLSGVGIKKEPVWKTFLSDLKI